MISTSSPSFLLAITCSPLTGRSYHATERLSAGACILDVPTPYTCTLYKQFRNEVCAECWKYDGGRRSFLGCREYGEEAGLSFCDEHCRDSWLGREGHELIGLLKTVEAARRKKAKGKEKEKTTEEVPVALSKGDIERAWEKVSKLHATPKTLRKWRELQLDDFEADMARYVLVALYHYAQEQTDHAHLGSITPVLSAFGAHWTDFAGLQSNETHQVTKFPELLENHIRIYQVLRSRFTTSEEASPTLRALVQVITTANVQVALGVDPGNSFGIWEVPVTEESEGLGFGIYPIPSFFNHREFYRFNTLERYEIKQHRLLPKCSQRTRWSPPSVHVNQRCRARR